MSEFYDLFDGYDREKIDLAVERLRKNDREFICQYYGVSGFNRLSLFNNSSNSNAYVGYMYGTVNSEKYEDEHQNNASSVIKIYLDSWFNKNLKDYSNFISNNVIYCANRKTSSFDYKKLKNVCLAVVEILEHKFRGKDACTVLTPEEQKQIAS